MKKVFATLCAATMALGMSAAVTSHYGVELGYDHGWAHLRSNNYPGYSVFVDQAKMDGFHVGGNVQLDFMEGQHRPSLVIGLNYQFLANNIASWDSKTKQKIDVFKSSAKEAGATNISAYDYAFMHSLQIPVRVQYTYMINNDWRFFCYTGPQVRLHLAFTETANATCNYDGKKTGAYANMDVVSGNVTSKTWLNGEEESATEQSDQLAYFNCFDMSWGFGVGFGWKSLSLAFNYDLGMVDIAKAQNADNVRFNSDALAVTLGFRLK